jgi:Flp pilus assembly protein TadD
MTPLDYAKTQCKVIIRYLRLTFWPSGLVFDYAWPPARSFAQFAPWAAALLGILGWTIHSLRRWPELGFCCVSFFLILAPTSSLVPIGDVIFEHRMYLPLAAVVAAVALCVYLHGKRLLNRMATSDGSRAVVASILGYGLSGAIVASLAVLTVIRNGDYSSEIAIWRDTVNKRDRSQRAHSSLGIAYAKGGHHDLALLHYDRAIELDPKYASPHVGRGVIHGRRGDHDKAIQEFSKAIELDPNSSAAYKNRGAAYLYRHDYPKALADVDTAIQLDPYNASAHEARNEILAQMQSAR